MGALAGGARRGISGECVHLARALPSSAAEVGSSAGFLSDTRAARMRNPSLALRSTRPAWIQSMPLLQPPGFASSSRACMSCHCERRHAVPNPPLTLDLFSPLPSFAARALLAGARTSAMAIAGIPLPPVAGSSAARSRRRRASEEGGGGRDREQQRRHRRERLLWPFGGLRAAECWSQLEHGLHGSAARTVCSSITFCGAAIVACAQRRRRRAAIVACSLTPIAVAVGRRCISNSNSRQLCSLDTRGFHSFSTPDPTRGTRARTRTCVSGAARSRRRRATVVACPLTPIAVGGRGRRCISNSNSR